MPVYALDHVSKTFGEVVALDDVSLEVRRGEIHVLLGENGAGKSSLMQVLYGLYRPDAGCVRIDSVAHAFESSADAQACGIGMVHQEFMLVPTLSVIENILLGRDEGRGPFRQFPDWSAARRRIEALGAAHGLRLDCAARIETLPIGVRQRVEIMKLLYGKADLLILDEPTAVLAPDEIAGLFALLRQLRDAGHAVLLVTHKLAEIMQLADRVSVMRRGRIIETRARGTYDLGALSRLMMGDAPALPIRSRIAPAAERLLVRGLRLPGNRIGVTFSVRAGEIFGIAGVDGNGQTELADAIAGLMPAPCDALVLDGHSIAGLSVAHRRAAGVAYVPADRGHVGSIGAATLEETAELGRRARGFLLWPDALRARARAILEAGHVVPADPALRTASLSGGNRQKLIVAREVSGRPTVLIAVYPTRGVDVAAAAAIWSEIDALRLEGAAVVLISSDLDEIFDRADQIAVLSAGRLTPAVARDEADLGELAHAMAGVHGNAA